MNKTNELALDKMSISLSLSIDLQNAVNSLKIQVEVRNKKANGKLLKLTKK